MQKQLRRLLTFTALTAAQSVAACTDRSEGFDITKDADADSGRPTSHERDASHTTSKGNDKADASQSVSFTTGLTSIEVRDAGNDTIQLDASQRAVDAHVSSDAQTGTVDLAISSATIPADGFTNVEVPETSCKIQDGCYGGTGTRTIIPFELTIVNAGTAPFEIGAPWENDNFYLSACASQYLTTNFVKAEVLSETGAVLAVRSLPTSCIAAPESNTFSCSVQGLEVGATSQQPALGCDGLDVTGLAAGAYTVRFTVNADGRFAESDSTNNTIEVALAKPECDEQFCGGVCCPASAACIDNVCALPDLRANKNAVERSLIIQKQTFGENSCELEEMCITGPGKRRLLQFEGRIENAGTGDLNPGAEHDNPLFEHSECHGHYHFLDFTDYKLLKPDGSVASQGHKQSFCLVDMEPVDEYSGPSYGYPPTRPEPGDTGCSYLSAGWADIYGVGTPCQWIDVTDVAPGDYVVQVTVNPAGKIAESNVDNNVIQVPVNIPADSKCQEEEVCGDVVDQDCDGQPDAGDSDCFEELCCGREDDFCNLGDNWTCDCNGEPAWEQHDCDYGGYDGYPVPECCNDADSCNWANDGECDCNGAFEWDEADCQFQDPCCGYLDYCGYADDGYCDCNGQVPWESNDCPVLPESDAGNTSPTVPTDTGTNPPVEAGLMSEAGAESTLSTPDADAVDGNADGAADAQ